MVAAGRRGSHTARRGSTKGSASSGSPPSGKDGSVGRSAAGGRHRLRIGEGAPVLPSARVDGVHGGGELRGHRWTDADSGLQKLNLEGW